MERHTILVQVRLPLLLNKELTDISEEKQFTSKQELIKYILRTYVERVKRKK